MKIESAYPKFDTPYKIAIIGDSPGKEDAQTGIPFSGYSGDLLSKSLAKRGVSRPACLQAFANPFTGQGKAGLRLSHWGVVQGKEQLYHDIAEFSPNIVLLLGELPLRLAGDSLLSVEEARGNLFICRDENSPFFNRKCIVTHPTYMVFKQWDYFPLFDFDVCRAADESFKPELIFLEREARIRMNFWELKYQLNEVLQKKPKIAFDIEGYAKTGISCCSIATSPTFGFSINFSQYDEAQQLELFYLLRAILLDPEIEKIMQNGLYDQFCCSWRWKTPILGHTHDTMFSGWELYSELPKGLGNQCSIWLKVPAFKWMRADERLQKKGIHLGEDDKLRYNVLDSLYTYELHEKHMAALKGSSLEHYRFNMRLNSVFAYTMRRGIRYNGEKAKQRHDEIVAKQEEIANFIYLTTNIQLNPNSPKQMKEVFYKVLRFEPQYKPARGDKPKELTCDNEALLNLRRKYDHPVINHVLQWRALDGVRKQLIVAYDEDGRIRASYNPVGTETGRLTCSKSPGDVGTNLTTITKKNRDLYLADDGKYLFQNDLEGADGWTVAAHCADNKDDTMLEDYLFGLKPAKIIALMFMQNQGQLNFDTPINKLTRLEIKEVLKEVAIPEWLYFTSKRAQHATNYGSQPRTMATQIMRDSYKLLGNPIIVDASTCSVFQQLYLSRYPGVSSWQWKTKQQIEDKGYLVAASGQVRHFFGRRNSPDTYRAALAHEPQANTTYVTNLALAAMWEDPENRCPIDIFHVEPLHQVHDAALGQFRKEKLEWVRQKIPQWFHNPITIAGIEIKIPYAGGFGPHWGAVEPNHPDHVGTL